MIMKSHDEGSDAFLKVLPPVSLSTNGYAKGYIDSLNEPQREAATTTQGPLMVIAGAGSGKTKMLTSRICYLMDELRVHPWQVLAVTFTNKAAHEMKDRVQKMLTETSVLGSPDIGTFHSICIKILRREIAATPYTAPFVIYDDSDQLSLVKSVVAKLGIDEKAFSPKSLQYGINALKCDAVEPESMKPAQHNLFERNLQKVYAQYQLDLFKNNAIDFGEILSLTYRLFRDLPDLRAKYQQRYQYIHVDEYQDTNRAQYLLLRMLAAREHGGHENICVVGDEDQSIYKWRGADIRNILEFERDYPGAHVVKLEQNYRSTQTIIKAAGQVIRNNQERKDKTLWTANEQGLPVKRVKLPDDRAEAQMVVGEIKRLSENEGRAFQDFSIFYRTHAQSRQFEDAFRREKINYQIFGGLRFYDRKEIKDVLSYFRSIMNPTDSVSLKRIVNVPGRGIGKTTLDKLEDLYTDLQKTEPEITYWDVLCRAASDPGLLASAAARKLSGFVALMQRLRSEKSRLMLSELYHLILDETGYVRDLKKEDTEESIARIENLEEFDNLLQEFEADWQEAVPEAEQEGRKGELLEVFLEQASLESAVTNSVEAQVANAAPPVTMMTLHSSKGLEFPVVFMVGMEEGLFPSIRPWEDSGEAEIEEERRLCYVGMTRAREQLIMTHVAVRRLWGQTHYQEPARFFEEISAELTDFRDLTRTQSFSNSSTSGSLSPFKSAWGGTPLSGSTGGGYSTPATPSVCSSNPDMVGRRLDHPEYGRGRILAVEGQGNDQKIVIEFSGRQQKKFLLRYVQSLIDWD